MKARPIMTVMLCVALAACLAVAYAPVACAASPGGQVLTAGTASAKATEKAPKPKKVAAVKLTSDRAGRVLVSWKASTVKGLKNQTYTVRYAYNKAMKRAKTKTVKTKSLNLFNLKEGKKLYVQVRTNAKYGKKALHSKWSAKKAIRIKETELIKGIPADHYIPRISLSIVGNINKSSAANINAVKIHCSSFVHWSDYSGYYAIQYSYSKSMKDSRCKIVSRPGQYPSGNLVLKNLKKGKTLYVRAQQCCIVNSNYDSEWSDIVSIKIPSKWIKEKGHYEPVYTTVVDQEAYTTTTHIYYTHDGWSSSDRDAARAHHIEVGGHLGWEDITEEHPAVTHQEQTGKRWVIDTPGHWA